MKKKLLFFALCVLLLGALIAIAAMSSSAAKSEYYTYEIVNGEAKITDVSVSASGEVIVPDTLGGCPVTSIAGSAFKDCVGITSLFIPDSVTSIGIGAFSGCSALEKMDLPFVGASRDATENAVLFGYLFGTTAYTGGVATTQYYLFSDGWSGFAMYYIPASLKTVVVRDGSIGYQAFANCKNITTITLGDGVSTIGEYAFSRCAKLATVTIGNDVTSVGKGAFKDCSVLKKVYYKGTEEEYRAISLGDKYSSPTYYRAELVYQARSYVFYDEDGMTVLSQGIIPVGTVITAPQAPEKQGNAQYSYSFAGFEGFTEGMTITEDVTFRASYDKVLNQYTYTFFDEDGKTVLGTATVDYGTVITAPNSPTKQGNAQYSYTFAGWGGFTEGMTLTSDRTFKATYTATVNKYTYTFLDEDGVTVLGTATVDYGTVITAPNSPTKQGNAQYSYTFQGWGGYTEGMTLTSDMTFKATYTETVNKYTYTFFDEDGVTVLGTATVDYGTVITAPNSPAKQGNEQYSYTFAGWEGYTESMTVTKDITFKASYTAKVNQYTYTFFDEDGATVLGTATVDYGTTIIAPVAPTKQGDAQYTYTFAGWNDFEEGMTVTKDITFKASYTAKVNQYTYTFYDEDGTTVLYTQTVDYGTTIVAPEVDVKVDQEFTYEPYFSGYAEGMTVQKDVSFTLEYVNNKNQYTYTFLAEDGTVLFTATVDYGTVIIAPDAPEKPNTEKYTYVFAGFEGYVDGMVVKGNATFTATYTRTVNKYTYTFFDEDGTTVLYSATVAYGTTIVAPANPTKAEDALYTYAFDAWLGFTENTIVTEDVSFTASYTASLKGTLTLESTTVSTAWGFEFTASITGKQTSGTGGYFVLYLDELVASFVSVESAEGVTVEREGNAFTVTVTRAVEEGKALLTFTLRVSEFLTGGEHSFLSLEESETASAAFAPLVIYKMGDVNLDGEVDTIDALLIQQHVVGIRTLSPVALAYADTFVDGATDTVDALRVQQCVVGMDVTLGNRVSVSFVYENEEEKSFTVEHGDDLTAVPEAPEGYAWSEDKTAYAAPSFTKVVTDRKYYLVKEQ